MDSYQDDFGVEKESSFVVRGRRQTVRKQLALERENGLKRGARPAFYYETLKKECLKMRSASKDTSPLKEACFVPSEMVVPVRDDLDLVKDLFDGVSTVVVESSEEDDGFTDIIPQKKEVEVETSTCAVSQETAALPFDPVSGVERQFDIVADACACVSDFVGSSGQKESDSDREYLCDAVRAKVNVFSSRDPCDEEIIDFLDSMSVYVDTRPIGQYKAFCCLYDKMLIYGIFSEGIGKLIAFRLNRVYCEAIFRQMFWSQQYVRWYPVDPRMFESQVVAQGAGIEVVSHFDPSIPEAKFVLYDPLLDRELYERWVKTRRWDPIAGDVFARGIPAIHHICANYCDVCGGVDMCKHILGEIVGCSEVDLSFFMPLAETSVYQLLMLRDNPGKISLASAHIRYALARSLSLRFSDPRLHFWQVAAENMALELYPHRIVAQNFFVDSYAMLNASFSVLWDLFMYIPKTGGEAVYSLVSWLMKNLREFVSSGVVGVVSAVASSIFSKVRETIKGLEKFKPLAISLIKTIVRIAMDYSPGCLLLEAVWESEVINFTLNSLKSFMPGAYAEPSVSAQGVEDFGAVVGALGVALFAGFGKAIPSFKSMSDILTAMIVAAAAFNRGQLWEQFKAVKSWFDGDATKVRICILREQYPMSIAMLECYEEIVGLDLAGQCCISRKADLGSFYARYLKERRNFNKDGPEMAGLLKPALDYIRSHDIQAIESVRRRPAAAVFYGDTNIGKSRLVSRCSSIIAYRHKEYYSVPEYSLMNAVYNVNVGDEYASGYDGQDIWLFDELFQERDSDVKPSKSVSLLFTLVSTMPNKLNMAAIDDKGKVARVSLVLGATNVEMNDRSIGATVKSVSFPDAVATRIKYRIKPVFKPGFAVRNKRICRVDGDQLQFVGEESIPEELLYEFHITTFGDMVIRGDLPNGRFSWQALLGLLDREYLASRMFVPPSSDNLNVDFGNIVYDAYGNVVEVAAEIEGEKEDSRVLCQGWSDYFTLKNFWGQPKCVLRDARGVELDDSWEVVDDSADAEWGYREFDGPGSTTFHIQHNISDEDDEWDDRPREFQGIKVMIRKKPEFDPATIGLGLLLLTVGIIAVIPIARKLAQKTSELKDVADVVCDGVVYKLRGDASCYEAQGQLVNVDGKEHFIVHSKNGYRSYPQGVHPSMLELIGNQRTVQQLPIIYDSIFAICNNKILIGNAFAVTDSRLLLPLHIARNVQKLGGIISNGKISLTLSGQTGNVQGFHVEELGDDVAVICLDAFKLNGVRNNVRKLSKNVPNLGLCRQVYRDAQNNLHTSDGEFTLHDQSIEYCTGANEYKIKKKFIRRTSIGGFAGMCGAVYVSRDDGHRDTLNGGIIIGMHVAADDTKNVRLFRIFEGVTFTLNSLLSSSYPPLEGVSDGLGAVMGFESARTPTKGKVFTEGRLGKTEVPPCEGTEDWDVAHLLPVIEGGKEVDVVFDGIKRLRDFGSREITIPDKLLLVVDFLCKKLCKEAITSDPDWAGTFSGAGVLPSITRTTAAGYPLNQLGPTKSVVCLTDKELAELGLSDRPLPNTETLAMLNELLDRILSGREYEAACSVSTKEEARLSSKVVAKQTRLFAGAPVHEFLLQRRFFMGVLATYLKKNIAVNSALGIEPEDFRQMHDWLLGEFKDPWILTADYSKMDQCFNPLFFTLVNRVVRSIALGRAVGDEVVSDDDYVRQVLLRRLAFNRLMVGSEIIEPKAGHPSGSCLTTVFNIVADQIIFTYAFWEMLGCSLEEVDSKMRCVFLGDDSIVCCEKGNKLDLRILQRCANECGFILTGADKQSELAWTRPYDYCAKRSEYNFLGRYFTESCGVLDIQRLSKMLQFAEERRFLEVIPQAILSHREEVARYHRTGQFDWCQRVLPQLEFFGFSTVEEYVGVDLITLQHRVLTHLSDHPEKIKTTVPAYNRYKRVVAQGPGDGEPSEVENLGDAEFISNVPTTEMDTDMIQDDYLKDHMDPVNYAVGEILSRPYLVFTGSTGTASDVMLLQLTAASGYFFQNFNAQAQLVNKVYMRCRFKAKVIVASGPFVTGKLMVSFRPGPTPPANVIQASADPCTELDLSSAKSACVGYDTVLPKAWMSVENFVNPLLPHTWNDGFDFGTISIWSITPISVSVSFSVYCWLEDVELRGVGFTNFLLTPQGKDSDKGGKKEKEPASSKYHHVSKDYKGELEMMKWQWKVENTPQWLNTTAASVETTAGCVETVEESILGPVGNFLEKAGQAIGVASLFGACAPNPNPHFETFMQSPNWAQSQMICPVPAVRLAVVQTQKSVIPRTLFGNKGDEMNIHEFTSRMAIIGRIPWSGIEMSGTVLARWNVMPGVTAPASIADDQWTVNPSPLAFVAGTFRMWRGGIKYRLSVAKTAFHTGTLEVVWQMGLCNATPSTPSQDALTQRYIWDVTQSSSIEFEVPYVSATAWTQIYFAPFGTVLNASDMTTGVIYLNVINPLANSSGTVPSNIDIVLYIAGGTDIEFAMPGRHYQVVGYDSDSLVKRNWDVTRKKCRKVTPHGGPFGDDMTSDGLSCKTMSRLRDVPYPSAWAHLTTTGERLLSLRVLLKRFSMGVPVPTSINFNTTLLNSWYLAYIALAYTFWTGSWRVHFSITTQDFESAPLPLTWALVWNNTYASPSTQAGEAHMTLAPWSNATVLEVPWYSPQAFRIISDPGTGILEGTNPSTSLCEFAAGDDLAYGFQVGPPAIVYSDIYPDPLY